MRKRYLIILMLMSLLLVGCLGGSSSSDHHMYDGSPTNLEIVLKRDAIGVASMTETSKKVKVRIWKENKLGEVIYGVTKEVPINEITSSGVTLAHEVPADKGYNVLAFYSDDEGYFEASQELAINAPAETMTTASIELVPIQYEIVVPDKMYHGGTMNQFKIIFPPEYEHLFSYGIYFYSIPWETNGWLFEVNGGMSSRWNYSTPTAPLSVSAMHEPRIYYYQFKIVPEAYNNERWHYFPHIFIPNLETGAELPTFTVYPSL